MSRTREMAMNRTESEDVFAARRIAARSKFLLARILEISDCHVRSVPRVSFQSIVNQSISQSSSPIIIIKVHFVPVGVVVQRGEDLVGDGDEGVRSWGSEVKEGSAFVATLTDARVERKSTQ